MSQIPNIVVPQELLTGVGVWNQYTIRIIGENRNGASDKYRDSVRNQLQEQGVNTMLYYPLPLHLQPVYKYLHYKPGQFPISEQACKEVLSLPMFPELTQEQQYQVIQVLKNIV